MINSDAALWINRTQNNFLVIIVSIQIFILQDSKLFKY